SPGLTSSSMTATSLKSPMSGTFTSTSAMFVLLRRVGRLSVQRIDLVGLDAVLPDGFGNLGGRHRAFFAQCLQRSDDDVVAVDLEVLAQLAAEVAAAEAVGAEHLVRASLGDERTDLLRIRLDVIRRRNDRAAALLELARDEGNTRLVRRVQQV